VELRSIELACARSARDGEARKDFPLTLRSWPEASEAVPPTIPGKLGRIQTHWLRVADIFHLMCDLAEGRYQARVADQASANAKNRGTKASSLWKLWSTYKNVAHLVAAATLICAEARIESRIRPFGPLGRMNQVIKTLGWFKYAGDTIV
jgi:hypothetical protein